MDTQQLAGVCRKYGPSLGPLPPDIDGILLLWAISGVESSFGRNLTPRHEPAYDVGGRYATHPPIPHLLQQYGRAAACSYGPWQLMLPYAGGCSPTDMDDPDKAALATVSFLNADLRRFQPATLDIIGAIWNAGHPRDDPAYTGKLEASYAVPIPDETPVVVPDVAPVVDPDETPAAPDETPST